MVQQVPRATHRGRARSRVGRPATAVLCGVVVAVLGPPSTAAAAPPVHETSERVVVRECTGTADGTTASLEVSWADGNAFDSALTLREDGVIVAQENPSLTSATWDGSVLRGDMVLLDTRPGPGDGSITAAFELALDAAGEPTTETSRWRDGNATVRETVVDRPLAVTGTTLTVTQGSRQLTFPLDGCTGAATTTLTVTSWPDTVVSTDPPDLRAECEAVNGDGDLLLLGLSSLDGPGVDVAVVSGDRVVWGSHPIDFSRPPQPVRATVELVTEGSEGELPPAGTAVVDLTSEKVGQTRTTLVYQGGRDRLSTTAYRLAGTVTVDELAPFEIAGCEGSVTTAHDRTSSPAGPGAGGPAPANDAPETAAPLRLGATAVNAQTRGAVEDLEAPMSCEAESEDGLLTPGHSLWYRLPGTGAPVTFDPSGSSFNTVLAVYRLEGEELVEVACVDDAFGVPDPTTQPPVTVDTVAGATYVVQAAGFAQQFGRLRLAAAPG